MTTMPGMAEPLTEYPLPDSAYADDLEHVGCILPPIMIDAGWQYPTRPRRMLPLGTRWRCPGCGAIHVVVARSPGRAWQREPDGGL